jgi:hypothetical protein
MERKYRNRFFPFLIGGVAAFGLVAFYMGIMTLTGDWGYAQFQFEQYRRWIIGLSIGLGIQSALFVMIKRNLAGREKKAVRSTLAASGGVSTASMVACCLHHATDLVPVLGFSVLAASLQKYQTLFFLGGVLSNVFGIFVMLRMMARHEIIRVRPIFKAFGPWFSNSNP